jgi:hypothetical protein
MREPKELGFPPLANLHFPGKPERGSWFAVAPSGNHSLLLVLNPNLFDFKDKVLRFYFRGLQGEVLNSKIN